MWCGKTHLAKKKSVDLFRLKAYTYMYMYITYLFFELTFKYANL